MAADSIETGQIRAIYNVCTLYVQCMYKSATMKLLFYVKAIKTKKQNSKEIENVNGVHF